MSKKNLSHLSDEATQVQNTAGVMTPILKIDPDNDTILSFLNRVATGDQAGLPIYQKLYDGAGNQLPTDTSLLLRADLPGRPEPIPVSVEVGDISAWNGLKIKEQRNVDQIDQVKVELESGKINIRDVDTLEVAIRSSAVVDWSQGSATYFERDGIDERPKED